MAERNDYIAVFDSGVGGISVLRRLRQVMPGERYLYFGDSANAPYGVRPSAEVRQLTLAAAEKLLTRGVKALVIACNTATSAAYEALKERYPHLILTGIEPALSVAAERYPGAHVGVMATPTTLRGARFRENKQRFENVCTITPLPAPGLMELVEAGKYDSPEAEALIRAVLSTCEPAPDVLLLGCTHYPFTEKAIRRVVGEHTVILDGALRTAQQTKDALTQAGLLYDGPGEVIMENSLPQERILQLCRQLAGLE
jgi:glutamate racemase